MNARAFACSLLLAVPLHAAEAQNADACRHEPARSMTIGGIAGAAVFFGYIFLRDSDHRITAPERLPYAWGGAWGATLGAKLGSIHARDRCPNYVADAVEPLRRNCPHAAWTGAWQGALDGGLVGFLVAPVVMAPPAIAYALGGRTFNFNKAVYLTTAAAAGIGTSIGAVHASRACSNGR